MRRNPLPNITPLACLNAAVVWFKEDLGLTPETAKIVRTDGSTWLAFTNLSSDGDLDSDELEPIVRALISRRDANDTDLITLSDVLIVEFHSTNPTPRSEKTPRGTSTSLFSPWQTLAIISTAQGVLARDCAFVRAEWGETIRWPFNDKE